MPRGQTNREGTRSSPTWDSNGSRWRSSGLDRIVLCLRSPDAKAREIMLRLNCKPP